MSIVTAFSDGSPGGTANSPKTGDLSGSVTAGSTDVVLLISNKGDEPCNLYWRKTGTVPYYLLQISPQQAVEQWVSLTSARTFEYYFNASSIQIDVAYFFGTGLSSTVSISDIISRLVKHGYTISTSGDMTSAEVQLCIDDVTAEVTMVATRYALIAMQTLNADWKNFVIRKGALALALHSLRNKGGAQGRQAQAIGVSNATVDFYMAEYRGYVERISQGIYYGA